MRAPRDASRTGAANADATSNASTGASSEAAPAPVVTAVRLVVEIKDGSRIEREMSGVRRVTVENNQLVIIGRDGRAERIPMVNVLRMSIEP